MLTSEIGTGLVRGRCGGRALPAGDVDGFEVFGHLSHLNRVETAYYVQRQPCI